MIHSCRSLHTPLVFVVDVMFFAMGIAHLMYHLYLGPYGCRTTMDACSLALRSQVGGCVPQSFNGRCVHSQNSFDSLSQPHLYISLCGFHQRQHQCFFPAYLTHKIVIFTFHNLEPEGGQQQEGSCSSHTCLPQTSQECRVLWEWFGPHMYGGWRGGSRAI